VMFISGPLVPGGPLEPATSSLGNGTPLVIKDWRQPGFPESMPIFTLLVNEVNEVKLQIQPQQTSMSDSPADRGTNVLQIS
jgi:hypothetical protein